MCINITYTKRRDKKFKFYYRIYGMNIMICFYSFLINCNINMLMKLYSKLF